MARNPVQLLEIEIDLQLGSDDGIYACARGDLDLVHCSWSGRIQERDGDRLRSAAGEAERNRSMFLREVRGNERYGLAMDRIEVLLKRCRHSLLAR